MEAVQLSQEVKDYCKDHLKDHCRDCKIVSLCKTSYPLSWDNHNNHTTKINETVANIK